MNGPETHHSHIRLNNSLTHLVQYGSKDSFFKLTRHQSSSESLEIIMERQQGQSSRGLNKTMPTDGATSSRRENSRLAKLKQLIVFVPGNPGILGVYHDFLVRLYKTVVGHSTKRSNTIIVGIGHNNFDHIDSGDYESSDKICIEDGDLNFIERSIAKDHRPHDVELQVLNKVIIMKKLIKVDPERCRIVFIGHSIGCYVILRMLQDKIISASHVGSILIHPALENLALTRKGAKISRYFDVKLDLVMRFVAYVCENVLPKSIRMRLTRWLCSPDFIQSSSEIVIESVAQLGCSTAVKALVEMAKSEFECVRDIDHKTLIEPHVSKLRLIYTDGDAWVNVENKEELRASYPTLHIDEQSTLHAFMMRPDVVENYVMKVAMLVQDCFDNSPSSST